MRRREIKSVEIGESVKLSDKMKKFYREKAYEFTNIGGASSERMPQKNAEGSFFSWMLLGHGYPYKAKVVDYLSDVGEGPGFRVAVTFAHGQEYSTIVSYRDVIRKKK
jgi:hypothetical protein